MARASSGENSTKPWCFRDMSRSRTICKQRRPVTPQLPNGTLRYVVRVRGPVPRPPPPVQARRCNNPPWRGLVGPGNSTPRGWSAPSLSHIEQATGRAEAQGRGAMAPRLAF